MKLNSSIDITITIPFGQTEDQKIGTLGTKEQISIWYDHTLAYFYLQNDSDDTVYIMLAYYDGTLIPSVGDTFPLEKDTFVILDKKDATKNNQQLAISNCSITMPDESIAFDYNNLCVYNDYVKQNTILMSVVTTNGDENTLQ